MQTPLYITVCSNPGKGGIIPVPAHDHLMSNMEYYTGILLFRVALFGCCVLPGGRRMYSPCPMLHSTKSQLRAGNEVGRPGNLSYFSLGLGLCSELNIKWSMYLRIILDSIAF